MVFQLSVRTKVGDPERMFACWDQKNGNRLKSNLGQFKYYQFLRTFFWDFSRAFRTGPIEFCHPGDGKICVSWKLNHQWSPATMLHEVKSGMEIVNNHAETRYKDLFGVSIEMNPVLPLASKHGMLIGIDYKERQPRIMQHNPLKAQIPLN